MSEPSETMPVCVYVAWLDTIGEPGWRSRPRIEQEADGEDLVHHSCGFLIAEKDEYVQLALSWRPGNEWTQEMFADTLVIPRSAITDGPTEMQ